MFKPRTRYIPLYHPPSVSVPTGTGFRHVTDGVEDEAVKLIENADVASNAAIAESKLALVAGATPSNFAPANPSGTSSNSYKMMGLGSTITITPLKTGIVRITISGKNLGNAANLEIYIKTAYGSGVAPVNGAAATGSVIGAVYTNGIIGTAGGCTSTFFKTAIVTGLTLNTAYWFDLQVCRGSVSGTVQVANIEATLEELPY